MGDLCPGAHKPPTTLGRGLQVCGPVFFPVWAPGPHPQVLGVGASGGLTTEPDMVKAVVQAWLKPQKALRSQLSGFTSSPPVEPLKIKGSILRTA